VCIAFMHRKSGGFSRVHLKHKVIEVSLVSMELMCVIHTSAIDFDMTFVDLLFERNSLNSNSNMKNIIQIIN
jgi:hypothetical protein